MSKEEWDKLTHLPPDAAMEGYRDPAEPKPDAQPPDDEPPVVADQPDGSGDNTPEAEPPPPESGGSE